MATIEFEELRLFGGFALATGTAEIAGDGYGNWSLISVSFAETQEVTAGVWGHVTPPAHPYRPDPKPHFTLITPAVRRKVEHDVTDKAVLAEVERALEKSHFWQIAEALDAEGTGGVDDYAEHNTMNFAQQGVGGR
jgi:hypothetical protein